MATPPTTLEQSCLTLFPSPQCQSIHTCIIPPKTNDVRASTPASFSLLLPKTTDVRAALYRPSTPTNKPMMSEQPYLNRSLHRALIRTADQLRFETANVRFLPRISGHTNRPRSIRANLIYAPSGSTRPRPIATRPSTLR